MTHVEALLVQSDSDCPSAEVVQAEVRELTTLEQRRGVLPGSKAVISDRGESISIAITRDGKTSVRVYRDAARDCERRGHFVSVLVVVSLMPPDLGDAPDAGGALPTEQQPPNGGKPATPEPATGVERPPGRTQEPDATTEPTPREPSVDHRRRYIRIEPYALAQASVPISDSARIAVWGGGLRVALGAGNLRFTLGGSYVPKTELLYTGRFAGRANLQRLDVALGVRLALGHAPVDTSFDAGLLLSRAAVNGLDSRQPARASTVSLGANAGFHVCWSEQDRLTPFLGVYADMFPFAPELSQLPQGSVGHLPYVWVGVKGGLALAL
jgi:hypothetical protein